MEKYIIVTVLMNHLRKPLKSLISLLMMGVILTSCEEFVEVDLPANQLYAQGVFEEPTTAQAAMVEIYSKMRNSGVLTGVTQGVPFSLANYTDEMTFYGANNLGTVAFYKNTLTAANPDVKTIWDSSYNQIYGVNAIIEGVDRSTGLNEALKNQLTGEALFVRSLLHFSLANLFGGIPYIKSTDYQVNQNLSRSEVALVYSLAKADVERAIALLPEAYIDFNRTRPNRATAQTLLARICLYAGNWEEASNAASAVLNQTALYSEESDLSKLFLNSSPTTIWQFSPPNSNSNTFEGVTYVFTSGPPPLSAVSAGLLAAFEPNDLRKSEWLKAVTDGTNTWYHPNKYKKGANSSSVSEFSIVFRTGELYLIRAEARARSGNLTSAQEDLNRIRLLAGLTETTASSEEALLQAIIKERRIELFTEFGHRFFDLKRYGLLDTVLSGLKTGWNTTDQLFPIPEMELSLNPNLEPQNLGY